MTGKAELRASARERRAQRTPPVLDDVLASVVAQRQVASYQAFGDEPVVRPQQGWLLPVLREDDDLDWTRYVGSWTRGRRGLAEPAGPGLGVDAIASCAVVLVPALLVDVHGNRLGKGGGSYDRALARATGLTIALVHDDELVEELPTEPHDVRVAAVATPSRGVVRLFGKMPS